MPTVDDYVNAYLLHMRAKPRERFVSTVAGTATVRSDGERVIYGPNGEPIRVLERAPERDGSTGNQIETDGRLHAVVRPAALSRRMVQR